MNHALIHPRTLAALLGTLCVLVMAAAAPPPQVARANGLIQRAETNLASVAPSLNGRTSPPRGSAAKVLANRLQQALGDLNQAKQLIEQVPAGAEGLEAVAARHAAALAEHNRLNSIMTGGEAPPPPSDAGTPLNYQQEEALRGANFNIREVQGNAQTLETRTAALRAVADQLSINHREVSGLLSMVENARRKSGFASTTLDQLPADGRGVAQARQTLAGADAKVASAAEYLSALNTTLQHLINPANYPEFNADADRLRELAIMFAEPQMLVTERQRAAEAFKQAAAAERECRMLAERYSRLIQQQTEQGVRIEGITTGFVRNHAAFVAAAKAEAARLPEQIRADLATARKYADDAVAEQKPLWFTGGIPQVMGFAAEKLDLLAAIDPAAAAPLRAELQQAEAQLKKQAESLRELIIRENQMPADVFAGPDREQAIKTAVSGWRVQQPEFDLLKVRIPAEAWARETKWTYSNGTWYFSDRSRLQVRLLIADPSNSELAIDRAINVWKDHQKGDTMIGVPLWGIEDELQPHHYLLRAKIR